MLEQQTRQRAFHPVVARRILSRKRYREYENRESFVDNVLLIARRMETP